MLRIVLLISVFIVTVAAGACLAADEKAACTTVSAKSDDQSGILGINPFKARQARGLGDDEGGGIDRMGTMNPGQSYDGNTGMPNVVGSDSSNRIY